VIRSQLSFLGRRCRPRGSPQGLRLRAEDAARKIDEALLINVQLVQERERVVEGLKQILVVLDHFAAHVDAKPLLVDVQLIAIEHVSEW
jgi:hypothetical protein